MFFENGATSLQLTLCQLEGASLKNIRRCKIADSLSLYFAFQQLYIMTVIIHRLAILILVLMPFYVWAATERYIIYPKEGLSLRERQQFTEELKTFAGPQGNVYTSIRRPNSLRQEIRFWCADLTEEDRSKLRQHKNVRTHRTSIGCS